ncbi:hypothetical protein ACFFMP_19475 [Pseudoroseomonas cervicalis]|uniref:hypothetical protein n=1 Tax=Teichococcus cervicalis TaxID=204525 RepID=UPI0035F0BF06
MTGEALLGTAPADARPLPLALEAPAGLAPSAPPMPPGPLPPLSGRARQGGRAAAASWHSASARGGWCRCRAAPRRRLPGAGAAPAARRALGLGTAEGLAAARPAGRFWCWTRSGSTPACRPGPRRRCWRWCWRWPAGSTRCPATAPRRSRGAAGWRRAGGLPGRPAPRCCALAPPMREAPPPVPEPRLPLLLARAGELLFALPAAEVAAVVPPQRPRPCPAAGCAGGVASRRRAAGAGCRLALGAGAVLATEAAPPLLRCRRRAAGAGGQRRAGCAAAARAGLVELPGRGGGRAAALPGAAAAVPRRRPGARRPAARRAGPGRPA